MEKFRFFDRDMLFLIIFAVSLFAAAYLMAPAMAGREMNIPPTNAFSKIIKSYETITADKHDDTMYMDYSYAQISDLTTQSTALAGAALNITLNTNDEIYGVTHSTSSKTHEIIIQQTGIYQIIAVPQIGEAAVQADGVYNIWLARNGVQIPNTNVKTHVVVTVIGDETSTETLNWVGRLNQNDVIYFQHSSTDSDIGIIFTAAGIPPATPSIIISIVRIS